MLLSDVFVSAIDIIRVLQMPIGYDFYVLVVTLIVVSSIVPTCVLSEKLCHLKYMRSNNMT